MAGRRAFPEAWFVLAVESGGGIGLPVIGVLLAAAAAASALAWRAGPADLLGASLAWALLLGPSNPVRGFALALALSCLARAGLPFAARAALAPLLVLGMAALVHAV
jgi:hypothetical protein